MKLEPMKHMHADTIVAWANGATIEYYAYRQLGDEKGWFVTTDPVWDKTSIYRVQPEKQKPIVQDVFIAFTGDTGVCLYQSIDSFTSNCRLEFDGDTGKLVACTFKPA